MAYKPTGNPPGRPRKTAPVRAKQADAAPFKEDDVVKLPRARRAWRAHYERQTEEAGGVQKVFDRRGRHVGTRPALQPVKG